jgi:hypothetical protein
MQLGIRYQCCACWKSRDSRLGTNSTPHGPIQSAKWEWCIARTHLGLQKTFAVKLIATLIRRFFSTWGRSGGARHVETHPNTSRHKGVPAVVALEIVHARASADSGRPAADARRSNASWAGETDPEMAGGFASISIR